MITNDSLLLVFFAFLVQGAFTVVVPSTTSSMALVEFRRSWGVAMANGKAGLWSTKPPWVASLSNAGKCAYDALFSLWMSPNENGLMFSISIWTCTCLKNTFGSRDRIHAYLATSIEKLIQPLFARKLFNFKISCTDRVNVVVFFILTINFQEASNSKSPLSKSCSASWHRIAVELSQQLRRCGEKSVGSLQSLLTKICTAEVSLVPFAQIPLSSLIVIIYDISVTYHLGHCCYTFPWTCEVELLSFGPSYNKNKRIQSLLDLNSKKDTPRTWRGKECNLKAYAASCPCFPLLPLLHSFASVQASAASRTMEALCLHRSFKLDLTLKTLFGCES